MSEIVRLLKSRLQRTPLGPVASEAGAIAQPYLRRLERQAKARGNDLANALSLPPRFDEDLPTQWSRIVDRSGGPAALTPAPGRGNRERVLFATAFGMSPVKLAIESILAMALRARGAEPLATACDIGLPACEFNHLGNFNPSPGEFGPARLGRHARLATCQSCVDDINAIWRPLGVPVRSLRALTQPGDLERLTAVAATAPWENARSFSYKDIQVGDHAFSSVLRTTLRGTMQDDARTRWMFNRYLVSSMLLVDLTERLFESERPDRLIAIHGVYLSHGTMCEVARKHRIPVVVFGVSYRQGTLMLSHDDTYHRTLVSEPTSLWEHRALSPAESAELDRYADSKRGGGRDYFNYHPRPEEDPRHIEKALGLDPNLPIVSLFTNVLWDAQIYYNHNAFDNMLTWLFATIEAFGKRPSVQLVIRIHPAEVKGGMPTAQPILAEIVAKYPTLPANVRVVPPESDVSSYTLAEMSRAALIYGTKMGLEIALRGIPVVVAGETFVRGKGITHDVTSAEEYLALLERVELLPRMSAEAIDRARRYAYHLYFRRMIDFPCFTVDDPHRSLNLRLAFRELAELGPGHPALDLICRGIIDRQPFVQERQASA